MTVAAGRAAQHQDRAAGRSARQDPGWSAWTLRHQGGFPGPSVV